MRALIDEHVTALDIATKIPPVSITDPDFLAKVKGLTSDKAKASEMEHALRFHIRKNFDEDPARYTKLSERLDEILKTLTGKWEQLSLALEELLGDATDGPAAERCTRIRWSLGSTACWRAEFATGAEPAERGSGGHRAPRRRHRRRGRARTPASSASGTTRTPRTSCASDIIHTLDDRDLFPFEEQAAVADRLMELAKANQPLIAQRIKAGGGHERAVLQLDGMTVPVETGGTSRKAQAHDRGRRIAAPAGRRATSRPMSCSSSSPRSATGSTASWRRRKSCSTSRSPRSLLTERASCTSAAATD